METISVQETSLDKNAAAFPSPEKAPQQINLKNLLCRYRDNSHPSGHLDGHWFIGVL